MKRFVLIVAVFLAACAPSAQQPSVVLPIIASATAYLDPSYPNAQVELAAPNQSASGIEVHMQRASLVGKNVNAEVCFTLPDASDWGISSASLNYAGAILQEYETTMLRVQEPLNGAAGLRCDTLTFIVAPDADLTNATIVIDSIAAIPRDDDYCSVYMPKIQQAMLERGIGILLDCVDTNGSLAMQIMNKPPEMTQEQAEAIVFDPEFYSVKGPWSFSFNLAQ